MKSLKCYFKDTFYHLSLNTQKRGRFLFVPQLLSHPFSMWLCHRDQRSLAMSC